MGVAVPATAQRLGSAIAVGIWMAVSSAPSPAGQPQAMPPDGRLRVRPPADASDQSRAYQIAMGRYEGRMLVRQAGSIPLPIIPPAERFLFTWTGQSDQVQRLGQDLFRLSGNDCLSHFCRQVFCTKVAWPVFQCSDGRRREMSAPDAKTMIFGGVTYTRMTSRP